MSKKIQILLYSIFLIGIIGILIISFNLYLAKKPSDEKPTFNNQHNDDGYVGSRNCRECHERFYNLWSPSHHGKAMQPVADVLKNHELVLPNTSLKVGDKWFKVSLENDTLYMIESIHEN